MKKKKMMLILVLLLAIGFASVSTTLIITGVVGVSSKQEDFNVIFTNAKLDGVERKDFIDESDKQLLNFETNKLTSLDDPTSIVEYEVTNTSRNYDAEVTITCDLVDDANQKITSEYVTMDYSPKSMTVVAGTSETGGITATLKKTSTIDQNIKVKCTLDAKPLERTELGVEYKETTGTYELVADTDNDGTVSVGDEIAVGEEHFYVISKSEGKINALAKYNLMLGNEVDSSSWDAPPLTNPTGIQDPSAKGYVAGDAKYIGTVAFSNNNGWPYENNATIDIKQYEGPVKEALYGGDGESGYQSYIRQTIPTATVRLITYDEVQSLTAYSWLYSTSYWTQSATSSVDSSVWTLGSDGNFGGNYFEGDDTCGVRPVITISEV